MYGQSKSTKLARVYQGVFQVGGRKITAKKTKKRVSDLEGKNAPLTPMSKRGCESGVVQRSSSPFLGVTPDAALLVSWKGEKIVKLQPRNGALKL